MNILVTPDPTHYPGIIDDNAKSRLESLGTIFYRGDLNEETTEDEYNAAIKQSRAEIVVTGWHGPRLTLKIYEDNPRLKYMCHVCGAVRKFVELEAIEAGLIVSNWGSVIAKSVAEGALMMILAGLRRVTYFQMEMHVRKGWLGHRQNIGLLRQKVGLFGLGAVARELVKLLILFDCEISAYDPFFPGSLFEEMGVMRVSSLEELFVSNPIISVHAANTPENYHIIDAELLAKIPDGGLLVNTARGAIIDENALIAELKSGRIDAALDVFEVEPLDHDSEFRGLENCLLIPHMAGPSFDRRVDIGYVAIENIENYINGREIKNVITPEKYVMIT